MKRQGQLLDRLIKRAKENGVPFVPDQSGPVRELYEQRLAAGHYNN